MSTLFKYNKTEIQENILKELILSEWITTVVSRATMINENLLVKKVDEKGRECFRELTRLGEWKSTTLHFN